MVALYAFSILLVILSLISVVVSFVGVVLDYKVGINDPHSSTKMTISLLMLVVTLILMSLIKHAI